MSSTSPVREKIKQRMENVSIESSEKGRKVWMSELALL